MTVVRWILAAAVFGLLAFLAVGSLKPRETPPITVQTATAQKATITRTVSGAGKLQPLRKVNVSSNITGVLVDLQVGIGSEVKKGQYLGQIDTSQYEAKMSAQKAQVNAAGAEVARMRATIEKLKRELARLEELADRGAAGRAEVEQARSEVRIAEAELQSALSRSQVASASLSEAKTNLGWATLTAPVDGTVLSTNHLVGERIRGSDFSEDIILVLGSLTEMQVRIEVGEHDVVWVKPGQPATIEIDALPDVQLKGKVIDSGRDAIVKNAGTDNEVTTFPVWVSIDAPPPKALSGMSAQVVIETETKADVVAVPIGAVTVRPGGPPKDAKDGPPRDEPKKDAPAMAAAPGGPPHGPGGPKLDKVVFVVKPDGTVEKRKVTVGLASDQMVEIVTGLAEGETIVEGPYRVLARELQDGQKVATDKPRNSAPPGGPPKAERKEAAAR